MDAAWSLMFVSQLLSSTNLALFKFAFLLRLVEKSVKGRNYLILKIGGADLLRINDKVVSLRPQNDTAQNDGQGTRFGWMWYAVV